jgi:predicted N-formylglutamate amidohydrolase
MVRSPYTVVLSCEHGGNRVPASCRALFKGKRALLESHRGCDAGALTLARALARAFDAPLFATTISRLVVDCNRTLGTRTVFSEITRPLPPAERTGLLERHYHPHRNAVQIAIARRLAAGHTVAHISVHTFTPVRDGKVRTTDIGLLHDPDRPRETAFVGRWQRALHAAAPRLHIHRNRPYAGTEDGLTRYLRTLFPRRYLGLELEVNAKHATAPATERRLLRDILIQSLRAALDS